MKKQTAYILVGFAVLGFSAGVYFKRKNILNYIDDIKNAYYFKTLHKSAIPKLKKLIAYARKKGYRVIITSGYRSFYKQYLLHKQNSKNAKSGHSAHNYGMAIDLNLEKDGKWYKKSTSKKEWEKTGIPQYARSLGIKWGGDYKYYNDAVHFQYIPKNLKGSELLKLAHNQFGFDNKNIIGYKIKV